MECKRREGDYTFMRIKDSWTYTYIVTVARKYIMPSVTIVRTTAENLSASMLWYAHQAMTMNADGSRCLP